MKLGPYDDCPSRERRETFIRRLFELVLPREADLKTSKRVNQFVEGLAEPEIFQALTLEEAILVAESLWGSKAQNTPSSTPPSPWIPSPPSYSPTTTLPTPPTEASGNAYVREAESADFLGVTPCGEGGYLEIEPTLVWLKSKLNLKVPLGYFFCPPTPPKRYEVSSRAKAIRLLGIIDDTYKLFSKKGSHFPEISRTRPERFKAWPAVWRANRYLSKLRLTSDNSRRVYFRASIGQRISGASRSLAPLNQILSPFSVPIYIRWLVHELRERKKRSSDEQILMDHYSQSPNQRQFILALEELEERAAWGGSLWNREVPEVLASDNEPLALAASVSPLVDSLFRAGLLPPETRDAIRGVTESPDARLAYWREELRRSYQKLFSGAPLVSPEDHGSLELLWDGLPPALLASQRLRAERWFRSTLRGGKVGSTN